MADPDVDVYTKALWNFDSQSVVDTVVDDCEDTTDWSVNGGGVLSSDDVVYVVGSASVRNSVTFTGAGGSQSFISLGGVDWSHKHSLRLWLWIDTKTNLNFVKVGVRTKAADWTDYLLSGDVSGQMTAGEWALIELAFDSDFSTAAGSPDLSDVYDVYVDLNASAAQTFHLNIDQIVVREHRYSDASGFANTAYAIGAKPPNYPSPSDADLVAMWTMKEGTTGTPVEKDDFDSYTAQFPDSADPFADARTAGLWDFDSLTVSDTQINACDVITDWSTAGTGLAIDDVDYMEGSGSVTATSNAAGDAWLYGCPTYNPAGTWDWSKKYAIILWVKLDARPNTARVEIKDTDGDFLYYDFVASGADVGSFVTGEWNRLVLPLDEMGESGTFNSTSIDYVRINIKEPATPVNPQVWVDDIQIREHRYADSSSNGNTGYAIGAKAPNLPSSSDANIVACWNFREGGDDLYPTVWDDCEDLNNAGGTWSALEGDETVATTTTEKYGTNAIVVKGGTNDWPGAILTFSASEDWTDYKKLQVWIAPNNDDGTPATSKSGTVRIIDSSGVDRVEYYFTLSGTADTYILKECELNGSGVGDAPDDTLGTMDWDAVSKIAIFLRSNDDNIDFAFDHIILRKSLVKDETGNDNDMILPPGNSPTWTTGIDGDALSFDGSSQYAYVPDDPSIRPTDFLTVQCWVRVDSSVAGYPRVVSNLKQESGVWKGWEIYQQNNSYELSLSINAGGTFYQPAIGTPDPGVWCHVAFSYDSTTGVLKRFFNGSSVGDANYSGSITYHTTPENLYIGKNPNVGDYFDGAIDGLAIYHSAKTSFDVHKTNSCLVFDGSDDYVDCGSDSSLNISSSLTLSAWVKLDATKTWHSLVSRGWLANWYFAIHNSKVSFGQKDVDGGTTQQDGSSTLSLNTWYHVAVTYLDSEKKVYFYLNGSADGTGTFTKNMKTTGWETCYIGAYGSGASNLLQGSIDEVVIRDRVELDKDDHSNGWGGGETTRENVYFDTVTYKEGIASVLNATSLSNGGPTYIKREFGGEDWSAYHRLKAWVRHDKGSDLEVKVYIYDNADTNNYSVWTISDVSTDTWTEIDIDLSNPTSTNGSGADLSNVGRFFFYTYPGAGKHFWVDYLQLVSKRIKDESGNGNHLILGLGNEPTEVDGIYGKALELDGSTQYAWSADNASWTLGQTFTVEAWIKTDTLDLQKYIVAQWDYGSGNRSWALYLDSDNVLKFKWSTTGTNSYIASGTSTISAGIWYHVAAVGDGSNTTLYVNGTGGTPVANASVFDSNAKLTIGCQLNNGSPVSIFDGVVDGVGIYSSANTPSSFKTNAHLVFDGTDDYLTVDDDNSLDISSTLTLSAWVYRNTQNNEAIICKSPVNNAYMLFFDGARITLRLNIGGFKDTGDDTSANVGSGAWHHVAGTYDGTTMRVYIDGTHIPAVDNFVSGNINTTSGSLYIGTDGGTYIFNGMIDEVTISNVDRTVYVNDFLGDWIVTEGPTSAILSNMDLISRTWISSDYQKPLGRRRLGGKSIALYTP